MNLFDNSKKLILENKVECDEITKQISNAFDYEFNGISHTEIIVPEFPTEFNIGLIVGSSGSGKSTLLHECFGKEENINWDCSKSIASNFESFEDASEKLMAAGLSSISAWVKSFNRLSNGQQFRANVARMLKNNAVIDEFTSVVNRQVAISCSNSISKYIRAKDLKNIVFCSCHDDIIPYLNPDWVYDTDQHTFYNGRYLQRPRIEVQIIPCSKQAWSLFAPHHYLSGELNPAADCYMAVWDNEIVGFEALLPFPSGTIKNAYREHRVVILPDYQGLGFGTRLSESLAQSYLDIGKVVYSKTANPKLGIHRDKSSKWITLSTSQKAIKGNKNYSNYVKFNKLFTKDDKKNEIMQNRICYCHKFCGDKSEEYINDLLNPKINNDKVKCVDLW